MGGLGPRPPLDPPLDATYENCPHPRRDVIVEHGTGALSGSERALCQQKKDTLYTNLRKSGEPVPPVPPVPTSMVEQPLKMEKVPKIY